MIEVPMLKDNELIGAIAIYRQEVRPFTDKQIALVQNFAAQAVIAIENTRLLNELRQSLEQQTATADVLGVISSSPGELEPVFQAMLDNATRICEAKFGVLNLHENGALRMGAMHNVPSAFAEWLQNQRGGYRPIPGSPLDRVLRTKQLSVTAERLIGPGWVTGRAVLAREPVHVHDLQASAQEFPEGAEMALRQGHRTTLAIPLIRENEAIGAITIRRTEVRPFSDKQIELVATFADQAVIAIENARLLNELRELLQQQTATSEVLQVISSSPGELEPVFNAMLENATRICGAKFGTLWLMEGDGSFRAVALHNVPPDYAATRRERPIQPGPKTGLGRVAMTKQVIHIADLAKGEGYLERDPMAVSSVEVGGIRTLLGVPMLKDDVLIGAIFIYRQEVRPFTDKQITLLQNFAAQAVIAIENTRLLNELRESLDRQTATSEVLSVISSSPGELEPVFQAMLENAARICEAKFGVLYLYDDEKFRPAALAGPSPEYEAFVRERGAFTPHLNQALAQVLHTKAVFQRSAAPYESTAAFKYGGARAFIAVPMLKENKLVGAINIFRQEERPFTDKQIDLVKNFAAQAVIAIENTRLLNELRQSLEQQTATADVLRVISSSPGELEPVFQTILQNGAQLCEAKFGNLYPCQDGALHTVASYNVPTAFAEARRRGPWHPKPNAPAAEVIRTKRTVHVIDLADTPVYRERIPETVDAVELGGVRTTVLVPMLRENELVGIVAIFRQDVRPYTDKQIDLLQNFAAQAVIAIENTRLLNELRQCTTDLTESLEQQTATSEVLRVISSSPGELDPVFQAMLENATRICEAKFGTMYFREGDAFRAVAMHGAPPSYRASRLHALVHPGPNTALRRSVQTRDVVQIEDIAADQGYSERDAMRVGAVELGGIRTLLSVPMLKEQEVIGAIAIYREVVRPFADKQINLVRNFAAQAVIAIENTRLLNELRQRTTDLSESLEQQTATSEVLKVISSSPGELEPVFHAMLENATRICEANFGTLYRFEGNAFHLAAQVDTPPEYAEFLRQRGPFQPTPGGLLDRVTRTKQVNHTADETVEAVPGAPARFGGARSRVCVPMLKENALIGAISIYRQEVRPFTDKQIELVKNFAAQAVIAIENTRLLNELRQRDRHRRCAESHQPLDLRSQSRA